ncbi:MAG: GNAT family N-acetyltransferase [Peptococcaceae bacterium]|nr:GNAT family N-acetyltransferase [Peptococcaceae bacterium]
MARILTTFLCNATSQTWMPSVCCRKDFLCGFADVTSFLYGNICGRRASTWIFINHYYNKVYALREDEFFRRCTFAVDDNDKPVATSGIWQSYGRINTVLGFFILPEYEGCGVGRGLFGEVLKNAEFPIYIHTHPIANRAIKLYSDFGFKLITDPVVGYRRNNLQEGLRYLKKVLPEKDFLNLQMTKANPALLEAASFSELAEF